MPTPILSISSEHMRFTKKKDFLTEKKQANELNNNPKNSSIKSNIATVNSFLKEDKILENHKEKTRNFQPIEHFDSKKRYNLNNRDLFFNSVSSETSLNHSIISDNENIDSNDSKDKSKQPFWKHNSFSYFVNSISILIILYPNITKIFHFNLKNFSITLEIFIVLFITYIVKFILDWPWNWFLSSNRALIQIRSYKDNLENIYKQDPLIKENMRANFNKIKFQYYISLGLCILTPLISGFIFLLTRICLCLKNGSENINNEVLFSDLNIGVFIVSELCMIIFKLSDKVQEATILIEKDSLKMLRKETDRSKAEQEELMNRSLRQDDILNYLNSKIDCHDSFLTDMEDERSKLNKQLRFRESESQETQRKLAKQEREIQQLRDLCMSLQRQISNNHQDCIAKIPMVKTSSKSPSTLTEKNSLHGIPLSQSPYLQKLKTHKKRSSFKSDSIDNQANNFTVSTILRFNECFFPIKNFSTNLQQNMIFWLSILWSIISFIPIKFVTLGFWITFEVVDIVLKGRLGNKRNVNSRVAIK